MAYVKHAVEPREDLLGHLRHCAAACRRYGRLQHAGRGVVANNHSLQYCLIESNQVPDQTRAS